MLMLKIDPDQKYKKDELEFPAIQINLKDYRTVLFVNTFSIVLLMLSFLMIKACTNQSN